MKKIKVSVPAKVHILGEHAVVYGKPALFSAINLRVFLTAEKSDKDSIFLNKEENIKELNQLRDVIKKNAEKLFLKKLPEFNIRINSQISLGSGLGSSAAISIALSAAFLKYLKKHENPDLIYEIALSGERIFHGNPSGGDVAACLYGGFLWFRKESELLRVIYPLPNIIHKRIKQFLLIDTGKPREKTREMVGIVESKFKGKGSKVRRIFDEQERLTRQIFDTLIAGDESLLINTLREGQRNLEILGVVSKKAKKIISLIEELGGAAKIIGGGGIKEGSGMLLVYHRKPELIVDFASKINLNFTKIKLGQGGLRFEK